MIIRQLSALWALATCFHVLFKQRRVSGKIQIYLRMILAPLVNKFNISVLILCLLLLALQHDCPRLAHLFLRFILCYYICFQTTPITWHLFISPSFRSRPRTNLNNGLCKFSLLKREVCCVLCAKVSLKSAAWEEVWLKRFYSGFQSKWMKLLGQNEFLSRHNETLWYFRIFLRLHVELRCWIKPMNGFRINHCIRMKRISLIVGKNESDTKRS